MAKERERRKKRIWTHQIIPVTNLKRKRKKKKKEKEKE
jgi:hypothetical protein